MKTPNPDSCNLFDPVEHAILAQLLELEPPEYARDIDIWSSVEPRSPFEEDAEEVIRKGPIRLWRDAWGDLDETAVSNAVARLLLAGVQRRLPQWARVHDDGRIDLGRNYYGQGPEGVADPPFSVRG